MMLNKFIFVMLVSFLFHDLEAREIPSGSKAAEQKILSTSELERKFKQLSTEFKTYRRTLSSPSETQIKASQKLTQKLRNIRSALRQQPERAQKLLTAFEKELMEFKNEKPSSTFPLACGTKQNLKGFKVFAGILETDVSRRLVFSYGDESAEGGLRRIQLSSKVGLVGAAVEDPVLSRTSKDRYVEAYVDSKANNGKGLVMCVSREIKVSEFNRNKSRYSN